MSQPRVSSEAMSWVVKLHTSASFEDLWPDFERWLNSSLEHSTEFLQAQQLWEALDYLKELGPRENSVKARQLLGGVRRGDARSRHQESSG